MHKEFSQVSKKKWEFPSAQGLEGEGLLGDPGRAVTLLLFGAPRAEDILNGMVENSDECMKF